MEDQMELLALAFVLGPSAGIEAFERRESAVKRDDMVLPRDVSGREALEAAGVVFGAPVEGDDLFCHAALPAGWTKVPHPEHHMYSLLLDAQGRRRATIFYKASPYDRRADITADRRFSYGWADDWQGHEYDQRPYVVRDCGLVVFDPAPLVGEKSDAVCRAWLAQQWPHWTDPGAYWSESVSAA